MGRIDHTHSLQRVIIKAGIVTERRGQARTVPMDAVAGRVQAYAPTAVSPARR